MKISSKKFLAIDTSARHLSLAVGDENKLILSRTIAQRKDLSQHIARYIDETLKKGGLKLKNIDGIVIGLGPGSFTGLRIGLSCAKALSFSLQIPLVGISSLDALALSQLKKGKDVCALLDARRGLFYAAYYINSIGDRRASPLRRRSDYLLAPLSEILKYFSTEVMVIGDGIILAEDALKERAGVMFAPPASWKAQAKYLLELGAKRLKANDVDRAAALTPIYLYPEDCQVQR